MFPYRSSTYRTAFFEALNLNYVHDGSTRYGWVRATLLELNTQPSADEQLPSRSMTKVIEYILDPDHFVATTEKSQSACVERMREVLQPYELDIEIVPTTGRARLLVRGREFISTAIPAR